MNHLLSSIQPSWAQSLGWILVHTLWQGGIVACLVGVMARLTPSDQTGLRSFWYAWGAFLMLPLALVTGVGVVGALQQGAGGRVLDLAVGQAPMQERLTDQLAALLTGHIHLLAALWALGVVWQGIRLGYASFSQKRLRRRANPLTHEGFRSTLIRLTRAMGIKENVRVMGIEGEQTPMVVGVLRPMILVPLSLLTTLPTEQLEALLAHELAHIRRHDALMNALLRGMGVLFFYNPGFLWMRRRWEEERECSCDDLAMKAGVRPMHLARGLLALCERGPLVMPLNLAASGNGVLKKRIFRMMGEKHSVRGSLAGVWVAVLMLGGLLVPTLPLGANRSGATDQASWEKAAVQAKQVEKGNSGVETGKVKKEVATPLPPPPPRVRPLDERVPVAPPAPPEGPSPAEESGKPSLPAEPSLAAGGVRDVSKPSPDGPASPAEPAAIPSMCEQPQEPERQMTEQEEQELKKKLQLLEEHLKHQEETLAKQEKHVQAALSRKEQKREQALLQIDELMKVREEALARAKAVMKAKERELAAVAERMQHLDLEKSEKLKARMEEVQQAILEREHVEGEKQERHMALMHARLAEKMKKAEEAWARSSKEGSQARERAQQAVRAAREALERFQSGNLKEIREGLQRSQKQMSVALKEAGKKREEEQKVAAGAERTRDKAQAERTAQMVSAQEKRRLEQQEKK